MADNSLASDDRFLKTKKKKKHEKNKYINYDASGAVGRGKILYKYENVFIM